MSVEHPDRIDLIATKPGSAVVQLVITDHLDWEDFEVHARRVQEKVEAYLTFAASGQLQRVREPSIPEHPEVRIVLAVKHLPTTEATAFLARVRRRVEREGCGFEVRSRPASEATDG